MTTAGNLIEVSGHVRKTYLVITTDGDLIEVKKKLFVNESRRYQETRSTDDLSAE